MYSMYSTNENSDYGLCCLCCVALTSISHLSSQCLRDFCGRQLRLSTLILLRNDKINSPDTINIPPASGSFSRKLVYLENSHNSLVMMIKQSSGIAFRQKTVSYLHYQFVLKFIWRLNKPCIKLTMFDDNALSGFARESVTVFTDREAWVTQTYVHRRKNKI